MREQIAPRDCGISNPGDNQIYIGQGPEQPDPSQPEVWHGLLRSFPKKVNSVSLFYDSVIKKKQTPNQKTKTPQKHTHNNCILNFKHFLTLLQQQKFYQALWDIKFF